MQSDTSSSCCAVAANAHEQPLARCRQHRSLQCSVPSNTCMCRLTCGFGHREPLPASLDQEAERPHHHCSVIKSSYYSELLGRHHWSHLLVGLQVTFNKSNILAPSVLNTTFFNQGGQFNTSALLQVGRVDMLCLVTQVCVGYRPPTCQLPHMTHMRKSSRAACQLAVVNPFAL
jgi:hypothetical protein